MRSGASERKIERGMEWDAKKEGKICSGAFVVICTPEVHSLDTYSRNTSHAAAVCVRVCTRDSAATVSDVGFKISCLPEDLRTSDLGSPIYPATRPITRT